MPDLLTRAARRLSDSLEPLWPTGCVLMQMALAARWLRVEGEAFEWAQYLLLGTLYPATLLAVNLAGAAWRPAGWVARPVKLALALFGLAACAAFCRREISLPLLTIAVGHWGLILACGAARIRTRGGVTLLALRWRPRGGGAGWAGLPGAAAGLAVVTLGWLAATRMVWWEPFTTWLVRAPYRIVVLLGASALVAANLGPRAPGGGRGRPRPRTRIGVLGSALALGVLALASLRVDDLGKSAHVPRFFQSGLCAEHHWDPFVHAAEMVRRGGWLLWDVPSQYGFLSILTIVTMPFASAWQSFYVLNAALLFFAAGFIFLVLRSLRTGPTNLAFALAVALAAVFLVPGWPIPGQPKGPHVAPSMGAFRFFWCYALLAVLIWEFRSGRRGASGWRTLAVGNAIWLLGTLWSVESAAYCAAAWLPSYATLLWRRAVGFAPGGRCWGYRARVMAAGLSVPPLLLLGALAAILAYYHARLGHGPDWGALTEYVNSTLFPYPIDRRGYVGVMLLFFAALSSLTVCYAVPGRTPGALGLLAGAWGAYWATASYFVNCSWEHHGVNLCGLLFAAMAVGLYVLDRDRSADRLAPLLKSAFAPLLAVLLTTTFGHLGHVSDVNGTRLNVNRYEISTCAVDH